MRIRLHGLSGMWQLTRSFRCALKDKKLLWVSRNSSSISSPPAKEARYARLLVGGSLIIGGVLYYYSIDHRERRKFRNTLQGLQRFFRTVTNGIIIGVDYKWNLYGLEEDSIEYNKVISRIHHRAADKILSTCLRNGGVYIKMGQALSAVGQASFVPKEYATTLHVLQDRALTMKPDELDELFLEDFGSNPEKYFKELDRQPIAAASLAQVFHAVTHDGRDVAVKCQYIDLQDRYSGDIRAVQIVLNFIQWLFPSFLGAYVFNEIKESLTMELDFINEGRNGERCAKDLSHLPYLYVPKIQWDLTSSRVLTTEFIGDAAKITEVEKIVNMGLDIKDVSHKMLSVFGEQIFGSGFVHADPHPGNIFVRPGVEGEAKIILLDHGLYETIPENVRIGICGIYKAAVLGDHKKMKIYSDTLQMPDYKMFAQILVQRPIGQSGAVLLGMKKDLSKEDMDKFRAEMESQLEKAVATVHAMPRSLFLVLRNMNLVRTICVVHGNPVDRYTLFARIAAREAALGSGGTIESSGPLEAMTERIEFELILMYHQASLFLLKFILRILSYFGFVPSGKTFAPPSGFQKNANLFSETRKTKAEK